MVLPPDRLAITTAAQTVYTQTCSAVVGIETRNNLGMPSPVTSPTTVNLTGTTMTFYSDAACAVQVTTVQIASGTSSASVYFRGTSAGNVNLGASANGLNATSQTESFFARPTLLLFNSNPPGQLPAGTCFAATLQTRTNLGTATVIADTPIPMTELPLGGTRYFSDSMCTLPLTAPTILAGQFTVSFYVKAITGGSVQVTATSPFATAQQTHNILPAVRRGSCAFNALAGSIDCTYTPAQTSVGRTALFFQSSLTSDDPDFMLITCELASNNRVHCIRGADVSFGSGANVHWQTLELPTGMAVQRVQNTCNNVPYTRTLFPAVNPTSTFVLKSLSSSGSNFDDEDLGTAELTSANTVTYDVGNGNCGTKTEFDIQVVELSGLTVTRGLLDAGMLGTGASVSNLSAASANRTVLVQPRGGGTTASICNRLIRAEAPTTTSVSFTRGAGTTDGGCVEPVLTELVWERIDFGNRGTVQTMTVTLPATTTLMDVPITAIDTTRTLVYASGQAASGQGTGETNSNNADQYVGEASARFELTTATNVRITREHSVAAATFTFFVVQIEP